MNKNLVYKQKNSFVSKLKNGENLKLELVITSNHNLSDDFLNLINSQFNNINLFDYKKTDDKAKK